MASSSYSASSSKYCPPRWKYDVFLSFRGEDTRRNFTSHLYEGLNNRGIFTFLDDKRLENGDSISEELVKAIEESQVAIIVFSKNYATSRWCLNELVKIIECKEEENGQTVIPIFYDVDPSHVRYQRESFAEAFVKHESRYKDDGAERMQKVQGWRNALTAAADLKGYDIRDGIESENIRQIVDHISSKLCKSSYSLSSLQDVVGINAHLENLQSLLQIEINDVRIVGIWGIGGVGKTTIAKAIFDNLSYQFKASCFLADVKENANYNQLHSLQNTLLSELLRKKDDYVYNKYDGKCMIQSRLCSKKVLVVLDDIDHGDHLEYLAGDVGWFGNGSRVIVTTRNRHLIEKDDAIYEVSTLPDHEAIQLFNRHAFRKKIPDERFMKLSLEVVNHAKGLPLALKVWGSLLHNKGLTQWTSTVDQIKKNSSLEIVKKLKVSYDGLELEEQNIFLDIACLLRGKEKKLVMQILESCDFGAEHGLDVLIDKSLVFISNNDNIEMHDLIQDMGRYVVKMQKGSGEQSRLWDVEDFEEVMVNNTGTKAMEAIWTHSVQKLCFSKKAMKNMKRLRLLSIISFGTHDDSIEYLPNSLRWLVCHSYPWESLLENFEPKRLVYLELQRSSLRQLWIGTKHLPSLRKLDLSNSERLMRTPNFTGMPNLEYLDLCNCSDLEEVHRSLECCRKLVVLNLQRCGRLKKFPCINMESLGSLNLLYCSSLEKFPEIFGRVKPELEIKMKPCGLREIPSSIIQQYACHLTELNLSSMENLVSLPSSICKLKGLVKLDVSDCSKLESFPQEIGDLEKLEELDANDTLISRPPSSIIRLNKLKILSFGQFRQKSKYRVSFVFPEVNEGLRSLEYLDLSYCNLIDGGLPEDIGCLSSLKKLILRGNNFEHLPQSISQLGDLQSLNLSYCKRLKEFLGVNMTEGLRSLEYLNLSYCNLIDGGLPEDIGCLSSLKVLDLQGNNFEHLPQSIAQLGDLRSLYLSECKWLKKLPGFMGMQNLDTLDLSYCNLINGGLPEDIGCLHSLKRLHLRGNNFEYLPRSVAQLGALQSMDLSDCKRLKEFLGVNMAEGLRSLEDLNLSYCNLIDGGLPEDIGCLHSLKRLHLRGNNFEYLPQSIAQLGALRSLNLSDCKRLKEFLGINMAEGLRSLEDLNLSYCNLIDGGLPEDIGCLSSLKVLDLRGNNFEYLPQSIAQLGALRSMDLSACKRLTQLPEFPQQLDTIDADWSNDSIYNSIFQNISSLQHDISASDSLLLRVFTIRGTIPRWFHHREGGGSISVKLPENWYVSDNFLGFAVCYSGKLIDVIAHLICYDERPVTRITQKLALSNHSEYHAESAIHFFLVPLTGLLDKSKANGKTPNDYGRIRLFSTGGMKEFGLRLLYKDEPKIEASCSSSKKQ